MPAAVHYPLINCQPQLLARVTRARPTESWTALLKSVARTLGVWRSRYRERHAFPVLDHRELRDLGLSRWDVERELAKPFWRG
ncbi:MAG: DUF1127 domain-containing protein [Acetobacteraceae bacterium]|jgi:uncharacterized protein YjiS (DUF1127 family)